ncbi:MAG: fimbria/pilus periplasmic chaperone [Candidatus Rickettsia vulgarisii]
MFKHFSIIFSLILFCTAYSSAEASVAIFPVRLKFNQGEIVQSLNVQNQGDYSKNFQLVVYKVSYEKGKEIYKETKDLMASPMMFKSDGGAKQLVRVAVINKDIYSDQKNIM